MEKLALDMVLQEAIQSSNFDHKNDNSWAILASVLQGHSMESIKARYNEMCKETPLWLKPKPKFYHDSKQSFEESTVMGIDNSTDQGNINTNKPPTSTIHNPNLKTSLGPTMVIHVCDETKGVKQDFQCPRNLLVAEMKYFAEYLSNESQRWEEVDISVHCDVNIFDWLMSYVKRNQATEQNGKHGPIEPTNVISILISSDFLKMDSLVEICIEYCHKNMNSILATPCNMNCINDKLVQRIANKFSDLEADDIRDKKDKFKSKIFMRKIERLFDPKTKELDCPENAATLHKCLACNKLLTCHLATLLPCTLSRMTVNQNGELIYAHKVDPAFDISDHVYNLWQTFGSWRDVYWKIWGTINWLSCLRCNSAFPCNQLTQCGFHPEPARYDAADEIRSSSSMGVYPCCGTKTLRFQPFFVNKGCRSRDHLIGLSSDSPREDNPEPDSCSWDLAARQKVYDSLLSRRDVICGVSSSAADSPAAKLPPPTTESSTDSEEVDLFAAERLICGSLGGLCDRGAATSLIPETTEPRNYQMLPMVGKDGVILENAVLANAPSAAFGGASGKKSKKWDATKTLRANQDVQRQEDMKRMKCLEDLVHRLKTMGTTGGKPSSSGTSSTSTQREYLGGIYCRLEAQWRAAHVVPSAGSLSGVGANSLGIRNTTGQLQRGKTKMTLQSSMNSSTSSKLSAQQSTGSLSNSFR